MARGNLTRSKNKRSKNNCKKSKKINISKLVETLRENNKEINKLGCKKKELEKKNKKLTGIICRSANSYKPKETKKRKKIEK